MTLFQRLLAALEKAKIDTNSLSIKELVSAINEAQLIVAGAYGDVPPVNQIRIPFDRVAEEVIEILKRRS